MKRLLSFLIWNMLVFIAVFGLSGAVSAADSFNKEQPEFTVSSNADGSINISWTAVEEAEGYRVLRRGTGSWVRIAQGSKLTYTDKSTELGEIYTYAVRAYKTVNGKIVWTSYHSINIVSTDFGNMLPRLKCVSNANGSITLKWAEVVDAEGYRVLKKINGRWVKIAQGNDLSYTDKTVTEGETYTYTVVAYKTVKKTVVWSSYKAVKAVSSDFASKDVDFTCTSNINGSVYISWKAVAGASGYRVYRKDVGTWILVGQGTRLAYTDKTAQPGKTYVYTVRAFKTVNTVVIWSKYTSKSVVSNNFGMMIPVISAASNDDGTIRLAWTAISGADGYRVYRRKGNSWIQVAQGDILTATDKNVTPGITYAYTVRAFKYESDKSKVVWSSYQPEGCSVRSDDFPSLYPVFQAASNDDGTIRVSWKSVSEAQGYVVYRRTEDSSWTRVAQGSSLTITDKKVTEGTSYIYTVRAFKKVDGKTVWSKYLEGKAALARTITTDLKVSGSELVDDEGDQVILRGVSTYGINWYSQFINEKAFKQLHEEFGCNVIRLALYTDGSNGYCSGGNQESLKALIKSGVEYATKNNMYVIIDWHILTEGNPLTHVEEAKLFFDEMASLYADYDNVLYEICNEPSGDTTWSEIRYYAEQIIPIIRGYDSDGVIIVGTPDGCQDLVSAIAKPLDYENIMYSLHFYAGTDKARLRNSMISAVNSGLPVFVSEFGVTDSTKDGDLYEYEANLWIQAMNQYDVSYVMWNFSNAAQGSSMLNSGVQKSFGFETRDLTASGAWLLKTLTGKTSLEEEEETSQAEASTSWQSSSHNVNVTYDAVLSDSWETNGIKYYKYDLTIINTSGSECSSWETNVFFTGNYTISNVWGASYTVSENRLHLVSESYNGALGAGESITNVGFIVSGEGSLTMGH